MLKFTPTWRLKLPFIDLFSARMRVPISDRYIESSFRRLVDYNGMVRLPGLFLSWLLRVGCVGELVFHVDDCLLE